MVNLHIGKDGIARSANVLTSAGTYQRPVSKLAVLDVNEAFGESTTTGSIHGGEDVDNTGAK